MPPKGLEWRRATFLLAHGSSDIQHSMDGDGPLRYVCWHWGLSLDVLQSGTRAVAVGLLARAFTLVGSSALASAVCLRLPEGTL